MAEQAAELPERESMDFDVVVVGAGPAGLATAIRLKQLDENLSVVVLEKGAEVGAHILSGAVVAPQGLDALLPGWREEDGFTRSGVTEDHFLYLTESRAFTLPNFGMPKILSNHGNFIASLGDVCRWLGTKAEALGVEIYPGFAANETLFDDKGAVVGVATGDMGVGRDGSPGPNFTRGMELRGKYTVFAEGARGQLSKELIAKFKLHEGRDPQKYGIGLKELWQVDPAKHKPGKVQHSFGWPLDDRTGGGSFLYHFGDNLVAIGFVVHLNYENPWISPFDEFQRFKHHPAVQPLLEGGKRLSYGARAITEGGWQSVPKLVFPGGLLAGCAAGFVNVPRIKGSHNAVHTGMLAAEHLVEAIKAGRAHDALDGYEAAWRDGPVGADLRPVRNVKPLWSKYGTRLGVVLGGAAMWAEQFGLTKLFGTMSHGKPDYAATKPAKDFAKIAYPKPDGKISFDKLSSVFLSSTNHEEGQPAHLKVKDWALQKSSEHDVYAGPSQRYCPAGVYEWLEEPSGPRFQINAQNCVHCKTCDIKDPNQNIVWVAPEGGGGPVYSGM
ncbi:4Fe-4S dicluster domain-containing protein [Hansschlegelia quercus]|uniref:Electron transfer flavoprotein-ubiquinone oxidoreductase n=1 Tax=Hansschlegelia quercus TaxID=2528245 RepID=A0A4Q9GSK9_9HYPH|nr:electron transfer flavoprotein-ubiquinone oxidoreductase [Hansschlegelia quercus]TBN55180.1 electron transfer flavoprotein-ubiquinone oxidoreductase [Hansschlegelia quercus]